MFFAGLAGIHIIRNELKEAAGMYREVLWSAKDHSKNIKTDRLQQLHALHNLAQLLEACKTTAAEMTGLNDDNNHCQRSTSDSITKSREKNAVESDSTGKRLPSTDLSIDMHTDQDKVREGTSGVTSHLCQNVVENFIVKNGAEGERSSSSLNGPTVEPLSASGLPAIETQEIQNRGVEGHASGSVLVEEPLKVEPGVERNIVPAQNDCGESTTESLQDSGESVQVPCRSSLASRFFQNSSSLPAFRKVTYIPQAPNDDKLEDEAAKLRKSYLEGYTSNIAAAKEQMVQTIHAVKENGEKFVLPKSKPWWNALLDASMLRNSDEWLVMKVKDDLEANQSGMGSSLANQ